MTDGALIDALLVPDPLMPGQPGGGTIAITATDSIFVTGQRPGITTLLPTVPGLPTITNMPSGIYSQNLSANTGSPIVVQTPSLTLQTGRIDSHAFGGGAAGDLSVLVGQVTLRDGGLIGSKAFGTGATGSLQVRASDSITMSGSFPGFFQLGPYVSRGGGGGITNLTFGLGRAGPVFVSTPTLTINGGTIASVTLGPGGAGDVTIQAGTITLAAGASFSSTAFGSGPGGNMSVTASEELSISGHSEQSTSFGAFTAQNQPSTIVAITFGTGRAGAVTVSTPSLIMFDGGVISTATGGDGPAGSITVNAGSMNMSSGASISSSSGFNIAGISLRGNGAGGTVTVNATGPVTITDQGSGLFTTTVGNGVGGNINLRGLWVQLSNGAAISATSTGRGNAGNVTVNAGNQFAMFNSSITTEANQSSGGAIKITTNPNGTVQLTDSTISASVLDGTGGGGSVNVDPQFVVLQNSHILANAVFGPGGNINLTTNLLLPDSASVISASSQFGQQGTISIQSPISPASGKIFPLTQKPLIETSLMNQRCSAVADGIYSSFTIAGRDSLPAEPGGWLSSPLALATFDGRAGTETSLIEPAEETATLSLRRIVPPGFLTQAFATGSTGCAL